MKTIAFSFLCLCAACSFARPAQGDPGPRTSASPGSEKFERMILDCINEMRRDPRRFYDKYLPDYIREKSGRFTASYTRSLKKDMYQAGSLTPFVRDPALEKCAALQFSYLARYKGKVLSHDQGSVDFGERMKRAGLHCLAENLYAAEDPDPVAVVLDLLIDQGVSSLGHRRNLLSPQFTHIGLASGTPRGGRSLIVMDFGCGH